ncbi:TPA: hypothetical protein ACSTJ0_003728 [Serratia fonticola]
MTLVVAGFSDSGAITFAADSIISSKSSTYPFPDVTLVRKFRKVIPIDISVRIPYFNPLGQLHYWYDTPNSYSCMIAFAGSTLVAQHIINNIQGHLRRLKLTYIDDKYKIIMNCEDNTKMESSFFENDMFVNPEVISDSLLTKDLLSNVIYHAINDIVGEFKLNEVDGYQDDWYRSDFIAAISCKKSKANHLFTYKMKFEGNCVFVNMEEISRDSLAIIGVSRYNDEINRKFSDKGMKSNKDELILQLVSDSVSISIEDMYRDIGYPVVSKTYDDFREKIDFQTTKKSQ